MTPDMKARARRALDDRLDHMPDTALIQRPAAGWIRAIRQSLGMTTAQLADRLGVSQPRIPVLEKAEANRSITLDSLERAAQALDCELVYVLVPKSTFQAQVEQRAVAVAQRRLQGVRHTMALEAQSIGADKNDAQLAKLARELAEKAGPELWSDK